MSAEQISVGNEILEGEIRDTNGEEAARLLAERGVPVTAVVKVGDDREGIAHALGVALERSHVVVVSGGLGATKDDLTREAVAEGLGLPLVESEEASEMVKGAVEARGGKISDCHMAMTRVPGGGEPIRNRIGLAPGFLVNKGDRAVICLPGVHEEFMTMLREEVIPRLGLRERTVLSRRLKIAGMTETQVEERLSGAGAWDERVRIGIYPSPGIVEVVLKSDDDEILSRSAAAAEEALGDYIFGRGEETLAGVVGSLLEISRRSISTAESCTGGMIGAEITKIPGSSGWYLGGITAYSNSAKENLLGIPPEIIREFGAVSSETARAMAAGARSAFGADLGLAVTGIAGPGGGSEEKPLGTVHVALATPDGMAGEEYRFSGRRGMVRERTVVAALNMVRRYLIR